MIHDFLQYEDVSAVAAATDRIAREVVLPGRALSDEKEHAGASGA
jgi:hypothetical protein